MLIIFDLDDTLFSCLPRNYTEEDVENITLYEGVLDVLKDDRFKKVLVTKGDAAFQFRKLGVLGITELFDRIMVCSEDHEKRSNMEEVIETFDEDDVVVIGDRRDSEVRWGNQLGCLTVLIKSGKHKNIEAKDDLDEPDFTITEFKQLIPILEEQL